MEETNFWFPWKFPAASRSCSSKTPDGEHFFQYQKPTLEKKSPYNVICVVSTQNAAADDVSWCDMIKYANQLIYKVGCFVISEEHPQGKMFFFSEQEFGALRALLDQAMSIYSYNDSQLFGLLRAAPVPIEHLPQTTKATVPNPLKPRKTDPYFRFMNSEMPFRIPGVEDTEHITKPNIVFEKDETWLSGLVVTPDVRKPLTDEKDTKDEMDTYSKSERFVGTKEKQTFYFHDCDMIYWLLKSFSLQSDLKIEGVELRDVASWNAKEMAFDCLDNLPCTLKEPTYSQYNYSFLHSQSQYELLEQNMEFEARLLCDLFTHTHVKKQKIKCLCTKFDRKEKKYVQKWTENGVTVCTLGILVGSSRNCSAPDE